MASYITAINGVTISHINSLSDKVVNAIKVHIRTCHVVWLILGSNDIFDHPGQIDIDPLITVAEVLLAACTSRVAIIELYSRYAPHGIFI